MSAKDDIEEIIEEEVYESDFTAESASPSPAKFEQGAREKNNPSPVKLAPEYDAGELPRNLPPTTLTDPTSSISPSQPSASIGLPNLVLKEETPPSSPLVQNPLPRRERRIPQTLVLPSSTMGSGGVMDDKSVGQEESKWGGKSFVSDEKASRLNFRPTPAPSSTSASAAFGEDDFQPSLPSTTDMRHNIGITEPDTTKKEDGGDTREAGEQQTRKILLGLLQKWSFLSIRFSFPFILSLVSHLM